MGDRNTHLYPVIYLILITEIPSNMFSLKNGMYNLVKYIRTRLKLTIAVSGWPCGDDVLESLLKLI